MDIVINLYFYSSLKTFCNHGILKIIREAVYIKKKPTNKQSNPLSPTPPTYNADFQFSKEKRLFLHYLNLEFSS